MSEEWSPTDYALGASALASVYADIQSTKKAVANGSTETNPFFGGKPSNGKLDSIGLLTSAAILGGADQMPRYIRQPFLAGMTAMRVAAADQNSKGKKFKGFADAVKRPLAAGLIAAFLGHQFLNDDSSISIIPGAQPAIKIERKF